MRNSIPLYVYLSNANNPDCATCSANSSEVLIKRRAGPGSKGGDNSGSRKLGLGLGLALSILFLIAMVAGVAWLLRRKRRQRRDSAAREAKDLLRDWKQASPVPESKNRTQGGTGPGSKPPMEADSKMITELSASHEQAVVEAPARQQDRVELEGDNVER